MILKKVAKELSELESLPCEDKFGASGCDLSPHALVTPFAPLTLQHDTGAAGRIGAKSPPDAQPNQEFQGDIATSTMDLQLLP